MSDPDKALNNDDYDLSKQLDISVGLKKNLTSYGDQHFSLFLRKVFIKALGLSDDALSRPIIGIINTFSGFNPCHGNVPQLIEATKRGILLKGGLPIEFPTISLHEAFSSPTSMFLRNLMSMDTEEMIKAQPMDACVMIGAQLMGGISANRPILPLVTGPMMPGSHRGKRLGACTDCRSNWAAFRAGNIDMEDISALNEELAPTIGTCGIMGTASTMACITAALGLMPLRGATAPAVSSARLRIAEETGMNAVQAAQTQLLPQTMLTKENFLNAITVLQALGGSTNAIIHLLAIINRHPTLAGQITLDTIDAIGRRTPLLLDLKPSGENYMTDFHNAGGMLALMHTLAPLLHLDTQTISGSSLRTILSTNPFRPFPLSHSIIRPLSTPLAPNSSLVVLRGNIAPEGCILKASASLLKPLLTHRAPCLVFSSPADMAARIDDPHLPVSPSTVLILQTIGPRAGPGMPEAGLIPIPRKLALQGVRDMLRISDGRMSGTAGGTVVLHVSPEAAVVDSVFGVVRSGDWVAVDVERRFIGVELGEEEIGRRIAERREGRGGGGVGQREAATRGYRALYERTVNQAHEGCDFEFLRSEPRVLP
ncbi:dihydroxy-acid and 6-phosphogluconate dehydratase [Pseudovirgaria hyperparasitica]|uniref:Dihydroxy-acid and 6-phosphogluconate dehydratase n=1 Tax=Pseudovirgaria hyperparasitica TaxID=470096 RepID=A0A6A6WLG9_9PEZI|nr:dihydroxy-acid and 6-phosphogluconate dehydratase [Pseudovirgaria hyperparasitica]KAF2763013.1 dihydroxy-acid and 6-phosphogluconate dehydratase [Pseudovirgaria hyperparasitica]